MQFFPRWLHPLVAIILPTRWKLTGPWGYIRTAQSLIVPEIEKRRAEEGFEGARKSETLLQWMMECAVGEEGNSDRLAHLELVLSLGAIHTTQTALLQVLYELAARPEYIQILRQEIETVFKEDDTFQKNTFQKLRKLDSVMTESQRVNPAGMGELQAISWPRSLILNVSHSVLPSRSQRAFDPF